MKTKLVPITNKSSVPRGVINALLGPLIRARTTGYDTNRLNFLTDIEHLNSTAVDAPVGYVPRRGVYENIVPPLHALDPTSKLAKSTQLFFENDRTASIGRTSTIREKVYNFAISGDFAEWWKQFCLAGALALDAERAIKKGTREKLDDHLNIFEGEGYIEAFLTMCGDLNDPFIGMSDHDDVDVEKIFSRVVSQLKTVIDAISQDGYKAVADELSNIIGIGLSPVDKGTVTLMKAEVFEKCYSGNLKRLLVHPHARRMARDVILSRIPANVCGIDAPFTITQGHDTLIIPGHIMAEATPQAVFEAMTDAIDARPGLGTAMYQADSFLDAGGFVSQFYTKGDLVRAIFIEETVDPLQESNLCVLLSMPVNDAIQGEPGFTVSDYIPGTGGLGSITTVRSNRINYIAGMQLHYQTVSSELNEGGGSVAERTFDRNMMFALPNGILDMSSPSNATAFDWMEFMRWYRRARSPELERVLSIRGENKTLVKMDLTVLKPALSNALAAYEKLNYDSQRDGVMQPAMASFNMSKELRLEQQGPALIDLSPHIGPALLGPSNGWNRTEDNTHVTRTSLDGATLPLAGDIPSSFFGEPQGKKTPSPCLPKGLVSEELLGSNNPELEVAYNMLSLPLSLNGEESLIASVDLDNQFPTTGHWYHQPSGENQRVQVPKNWGWNLHPLQGFKRGYVVGRTSENNWSRPGSSSQALSDWSRTASSNAITIVIDGGPRTVNFPAGNSTGGSPTPEDAIIEMRGRQYELQHYVNSEGPQAVLRSVWFWDPSQTMAIGGTNYALYGEYCNSLCFSAGHATHPTVAIGAIRTPDLNADRPNYRATTGSCLFISEEMRDTHGVTIAPSSLNSPSMHTRDIATLDGRIEQEHDTFPAVTVTNLWFDSADVISEAWKFLHDGHVGFGGVLVDEVFQSADVSLDAYDVIEDMSAFRRLIAKTNPYARNVNSLTGHGLNATDGSFTGATHWGIQAGPIPYMFDGPSIQPLNGSKTGMVVYGTGFHPMDERQTFAFSALYAVVSRVGDLTDETMPGFYPGATYMEHLAPFRDSGIVHGVAIQGAFADLPNLATANVITNRLSNLPGYTVSKDPWFSNVPGRVPQIVPTHLADTRKSSIAGAKNPWIRPSNAETGWKVASYDISKTQALIGGAIRDQMIDHGSTVLTGMTNTDWRDLYVNN